MKNKLSSIIGKVLLWIILISIPGKVFAWDWRTKVTVAIHEQSLQAVCELLEQQYGIHFSYSRDIVNLSRKVTITAQDKPLKDLLDDLFSPFDIHFARIGGQIVLTVKRDPQRTVSGYVQDIRTGERLIGATIYSPIWQQGTITNQYGFFSITLPKDTCSLQVTYIGYSSFRLPVANLNKKQVIVTLAPLNSLREVVVTETQLDKQPGQMQMSRISVPLSDIKSMPRLLGEADVMRAIAALPGVSGGLEGGGALNVRGGSPDQNLILLDGTPVFNTSHLLGIFSVFNPDIVKSADFYKGAFPARYGGRLSSVVDITTKDGDMQHIHGEAAIGLIAAKAMVEGPIKKDKTSFVVSARRSYTDLLLNNIYLSVDDKDKQNTAKIYFYDVNLKINHIFSSKDRIYLSGFRGQDRFSMRRNDNADNTRTYFDWGNSTGTLRWNHIFNPRLFANATVNYSQYTFSTSYNYDYNADSSIDAIHLYGRYYSRIKDAVSKVDFEYRPNPAHTVKFGLGFITHTFNPGVSILQNTGSQAPLDTTYNDQSSLGKEMLMYGEDEWNITRSLQINAGVHISAFVIEKTWYNSVQPRLGARYQFPRQWTLRLSYTHMNQYLHLLTNSVTSLPTDLWVPSTSKVKPMFSKQSSIGICKTSMNNMFSFSVEGYYKTMDNVIEYKENNSLFNTSGKKWDEQVAVGTGRSYGGEVLLEKKRGKMKGWIGYTLAWSDRQFASVNDGQAFPYKYDRRHDVEVVITRRMGKRWEVSASWEYTSGLPLTLPTASYEGVNGSSPWDASPYAPILDHTGKRNEFRSRDQHRLDLSATYSKKKKLWEKSWTFSLYNAYNKQNPFFYTVVTDRVKQERYLAEVSILPILPSVTYAIKF